MRNLFTILLLLGFGLKAMSAQEAPVSVTLKRVGDSLRIKAVPASLKAWKAFTSEGLFLERAPLSDSLNFTPINAKALLPPNEETLEDLETEFSEVALVSLYPEEEDAPQSLREQLDFQERREGNIFFYLFATAQERALSRISGLEFTMPLPDSSFVLKARFGKENSLALSQRVNVNALPKTLKAPLAEAVNGEHSVTLRWNHKSAALYLLGYNVLRSSQKNGPYTPVNEALLIYNNLQDSASLGFITFTDSLEANYQTYYYKLQAKDYFGENHTGDQVFEQQGVDRTPPAEVTQLLLTQPTPNQVQVNWQVQDLTQDLAGFLVVYSPNGVSGPFKNVHQEPLPKDQRSYLLQNFEPAAKNFFSVVAFDTAGNYSTPPGSFLFTVDSVPPALPQNLRGNIDTNGVVKLSWTASNSADVKAYRLFRAVNENYEFVPVTQGIIQDTSLTDTVDMTMLDRNYFYKIVALDYNYNHSVLSEPLHLVKPDKIAPTAPVLKRPEFKEKVLFLRWIPSSSPDVKAYEIYKAKTGQPLEPVTTVRGQLFRDSLTEAGTYEFAIRAVDQAGLKSPLSNTRQLEVANYQVAQAPRFKASSTSEGILITLKEASAQRVLIYRAKQGQKALRVYRSIPAEQLDYLDQQIQQGESYRYALVFINKQGLKSKRSPEQVITWGATKE